MFGAFDRMRAGGHLVALPDAVLPGDSRDDDD
jgi:hypothetical protein